MLDEEKLWQRLLTFLGNRGSVHRTDSGRPRVRIAGARHDVEIVMTPAEWSDMVSVAWGSFDDAAAEVVRIALEAGPSHRYLVYEQYQLVPSPEPTLVRAVPGESD